MSARCHWTERDGIKVPDPRHFAPFRRSGLDWRTRVVDAGQKLVAPLCTGSTAGDRFFKRVPVNCESNVHDTFTYIRIIIYCPYRKASGACFRHQQDASSRGLLVMLHEGVRRRLQHRPGYLVFALVIALLGQSRTDCIGDGQRSVTSPGLEPGPERHACPHCRERSPDSGAAASPPPARSAGSGRLHRRSRNPPDWS